MILTIILFLIVFILLLSCLIIVDVLAKAKKDKRDTRPFIYVSCFFLFIFIILLIYI